jgi:hypothetical protein
MASMQSVVSARIQAESQTKVMSTFRMFSICRRTGSAYVSNAVCMELLTHRRKGSVSDLAEGFLEEGRMSKATCSIDT